MVKVWRCIETGEALRGQGATTENIGLYLKKVQGSPSPRGPNAAAALGWSAGAPNAAAALGWSEDASLVECSQTFTAGWP